MRKPTIEFPTRSDTNRPLQSQEQARTLKFRNKEEEVLRYLYQRLCFRIYADCLFSYVATQFLKYRYCLSDALLTSEKMAHHQNVPPQQLGITPDMAKGYGY